MIQKERKEQKRGNFQAKAFGYEFSDKEYTKRR
jgi:hypothetical protein